MGMVAAAGPSATSCQGDSGRHGERGHGCSPGRTPSRGPAGPWGHPAVPAAGAERPGASGEHGSRLSGVAPEGTVWDLLSQGAALLYSTLPTLITLCRRINYCASACCYWGFLL